MDSFILYFALNVQLLSAQYHVLFIPSVIRRLKKDNALKRLCEVCDYIPEAWNIKANNILAWLEFSIT